MNLSQMRLSWVSGDNKAQQVQYADGRFETSMVTTFTQDNMCSKLLPFYLYCILCMEFAHLRDTFMIDK